MPQETRILRRSSDCFRGPQRSKHGFDLPQNDKTKEALSCANGSQQGKVSLVSSQVWTGTITSVVRRVWFVSVILCRSYSHDKSTRLCKRINGASSQHQGRNSVTVWIIFPAKANYFRQLSALLSIRDVLSCTRGSAVVICGPGIDALARNI